MKAIVVHEFGGPDKLQLADVPDPTPGLGEVVVRVKAVGINPVETYMRANGYNGMMKPPFTPGTDAAGEIESVGEGVIEFQVGQRVYVASTPGAKQSGAYAEKIVCETRAVHPLPDNISFAQGAALGVPYATAYRALFTIGDAQPGEVVLIHGASGGVGTAAVQLGRAYGLTVFGTAGTAEGLQLVTEQGAHQVFNHHDEGYLDAIKAASGPNGLNLIVEFVAHVNLGKDLPLLGKKGRVVVVGSRGTVEINPRDLMMRDAQIRGLTLFNAGPAELAGIHAALRAGLENGTLRPIVGQELPLSEAPRGHELVLEGGSNGKIVLVP